MKKRKLVALVFSLMLTMYFQPVLSQTKILSAEELQLPPKDMQWFRYAKFGMMIHWGLYSIPGQGEWVMFNHRIDTREYAKLADRFDALAQRWPINSTVSWGKSSEDKPFSNWERDKMRTG